MYGNAIKNVIIGNTENPVGTNPVGNAEMTEDCKMDRPIFESVMQYSRDAGYPWHMPGHKRGMGVPVDAAWQDIYAMDFTEIPGLDEYHSPDGIIKEAQLQAAQFYGTQNSYFLVNGSTVGILAAMAAVCDRRGSVLVGRNCHQAVYHGIELLDLQPHYLYPEWLTGWDMYGGISVAEVEKSLKQNPEIQAVILTSPTYEGIISDIEGIAEVVHGYGGVLIVDEAHGAHLSFLSRCTGFLKSACECGADIVIQSLHKTLPAMTQTAVLHRLSGRVKEERLFHYVSVYQSTSPSYVFMASMDYAVHYMTAGRDAMLKYDERLRLARKRLGSLSHIRLIGGNDLDSTCAKGYDDAKLVLSVKRAGMTGAQLAAQLAKQGQIVEMAGTDYVICMTSVMDSGEAFDSLIQALEEIDIRISGKSVDNIIRYFVSPDSEPERVMGIAEALCADRIWMPLEDCRGYAAGEYVYAYPPGSPILVPGERVSEALLSWIDFHVQAGLNMKGIRSGELCVVRGN